MSSPFSRTLETATAVLAITLAIMLAVACARTAKPRAVDRLHACGSDEGPTDAFCGTFSVFENRETQQGRQIVLKIVVFPALSNEPKPDPLFFLAGGPGQSATALAKPLKDVFRRIQADRDIVYVDQRGTGKSNPLGCDADDDSLAGLNEPDELALSRLKTCLAGYDADPTLYTTTIAMDDLDDVRAYLGYDQINIYGGSYGTRAGLVYLRQHGDRVRAIVLDGNAPTNMRLPLFFPRDAQRALDRLLTDCDADAGCRTKYPQLGSRLVALLGRLAKAPPRLRLTHPRTGVAEEVTVEASFVANVIASALYSPMLTALVPELVDRADAGDFQGLLAMGLLGDGGGDGAMSIGMQLSVICAEDYPRIAPGDLERESGGTVFATYLLRAQTKACRFWPKGQVDSAFYEPVTSTVPALVLSGDLDPVTPPAWGQSVADHLSKSTHVVVSGTGHGAINTGCGRRMVRDFIRAGTVDGLDTGCATAVQRPPFFLTPAGPDPETPHRTATP